MGTVKGCAMVEQCAPGAIPLYIPYCSHIGALYEMLRQFYNGWRQNELSKLYYARLIEKFEKMASPIWDFSLFIFAPAMLKSGICEMSSVK